MDYVRDNIIRDYCRQASLGDCTYKEQWTKYGLWSDKTGGNLCLFQKSVLHKVKTLVIQDMMQSPELCVFLKLAILVDSNHAVFGAQ